MRREVGRMGDGGVGGVLMLALGGGSRFSELEVECELG